MYSGFITPYGVLEYDDHVWEKVKNSEFGQEIIKEKDSEFHGKIAGSLFLTGDITQKGYDKKRNKLLAPYMQQNKEQQLQQQQNKKPQPQV